MTVHVEPVAIKKGILHACKYPSNDVIGIVTGKLHHGKFHISNVYPVSHSRITGVSIQFAFEAIDKIKSKDEDVIGVYECLIFDQEISPSAFQLSSAVREYFGLKKCVHVNFNISLSGSGELPEDRSFTSVITKDLENTAEITLRIAELDDHSQGRLEAPKVDQSTLGSYMKPENFVRLVDVDNHLENAALDIRNDFVN